MEIAAVLSSASTTNIRWFLWLFYFLSLFMSQSCLADHDQLNFNLGHHFSRKLCPGCSMKFELQPFFRDSPVSESMHLSASLNLERNGKKNRASKMYLSLSAAALVLIAVSSTWHMRRRDALFEEEQENIRETGLIESGEGRSGNDDNTHDSLQRENQAVVQRCPVFPLDVIRKFKQYFSIETKIRNQAEAEFQGLLPSVPFDVILKATQQFSDDKILGKGSFGVVYKGQLDDGELIAVKRFSRRLYGTSDDFINEIALLSHLRHTNVVKILGHCKERDEQLLIYEFISNRSLADVLFGPSMDIRLAEWKTRKNIINGIAQGLLYLHEDSQLKIIHRDLKPSNVLLDDNMNPKISDFGLAMIFGEDEIQDDRIVGTIGYIAPEYLCDRRCTVKSDVYSFGILLLEIITGKKNADLHRVKGLLKEKKLEQLVDCDLQDNYIREEVEELFKVALLCTQYTAVERPQMSKVVRMLEGDGLSEKWEEWQKEEIFRQDFIYTHQLHNNWIVDSTSYLAPDELSGPR